MTDTKSASEERLEGLRQRLVDAIESVDEEPCCECGKPYAAHEYWEDRIYDVNGRRCPSSVLGAEYRYSKTQTAHHLRERRMVAASVVLLDHERDQGQRKGPTHCKECGVMTGGGEFCYVHAPYTVWPLKDGSFRSTRGGLKHLWLDEPPNHQTENPDVIIAEQGQRISELEQRASRLEDAAFHFQTCATCRKSGDDSCSSGRQFAAFLRGEPW